MNDKAQDGPARSARECFERSVDALPAATANRLRLARRAAIAASPGHGARPAWALALGAAAALVLGVAWWRQDVPAAAQQAARVPGDVAQGGKAQAAWAPTASEPQADDDADLYAWLADTPVASEGGGGAL